MAAVMKKPNIVFVLCDNVGWGDFGVYGGGPPFGPDGSLMSVKVAQPQGVLRYSEGMDQPIVSPQWPMVFDLASDPGELHNVIADKMDMGWMLGVALKFVADFEKNVAQYPNIKTGEEFTGHAANA